MNIRIVSFGRPFILIPGLIAILISGCASTGPVLKRVTNAEKARVLDGAALSSNSGRLHDLPDEDVLGLTDEMKRFVDHQVTGNKSKYGKLTVILNAVVSPQHLGLKYDDSAVFTAAETFRNRRANCLSFTTMIVTMLRYAGLRAEFNDVDIPPVWDLQNNNMLVMYRHVNAIVILSDRSSEVVDFNMDEYDVHYPQHFMSDEAAIAQFFSNRGVEYLLQGNAVDAFRYLRKALAMAPDLSFIWINLGALYRSRGKLDEAEIAYRNALLINPNDFVAISSAARIYKDLGKLDLAAEFERRAKYFRQRNPYYLYKLAMDSFLAGDYETALENIHAAIRKNDEEHRFYFLQGVIYKALDKTNLATQSFDKAIKLSSSEKQADKYRRKIEKLM